MSTSKLSGRAVVVLLLVLWKPVTASSTPFVTQVASPGQHHDEPTAAESKAIDGFMEDIGFSSFFQDVGVEAAASNPSFTKVMPAASNNFPSVGGFNFDFGAHGEQTKEQRAAMKEQGFMPTNPFGSSSNLASSNIAPPDTFKNEKNPFGGDNGFKFPAFQSDFGFSGGFGSIGGDQSHAPAAKEEQREKPEASAVAVEHRPRSKSASSSRPKYAERRRDTFADDPYQGSRLYASPSKKEEKKNKGKCEVVHKDGMTCEICNDGHGGFSEHCSHSQNSGKDSKFTNTRKHTSDDVLKPKENKAPAPAPAYQPAQQRRVQQKQKPHQGGGAAGGNSNHPADPHSAFDFSYPSTNSEVNHQSQPNPHNHYNTAQQPQPVPHQQQPAPQQQYHPQQHQQQPQHHQQQQQQQQQHHHQQQQQEQPHHQEQHQHQPHPETSHRSTSAVKRPASLHQNPPQNYAPQHAVAYQNHNQQHQQHQQQPQQVAGHVRPAGGHPGYAPQHGHIAAAPQPLQPQPAHPHNTQNNPNTYYSYQQPQLQQNRQHPSSYPQQTNNPVHHSAGSTNHHQGPPSSPHGSQPRTTAAPVISDKLPPNYNRFVTLPKEEDTIVPHPSQESINTHKQNENYQQQPLHPQQQQYHPQQQQQHHRHQQQSNKEVVHQQPPNRDQQLQHHQQPQQHYNQQNQQHHVAPVSHHSQQEQPQQVQQHHHRSYSQKQHTHKKQPAPVTSHSPQENNSPSHYQSNEIQENHSKDHNRKKFKAQKPSAPHHGGSSGHHQGDTKTSNDEGHGGGGGAHRDEESQSGGGDKKESQDGSQNDSSDSDFDFDIEFRSSFGSSPYAQSQQDNVYDKKSSDPFEGFGSDPYDHFAEGSNTDPYKFEIPEFDESEFSFGPDDHKKLVKKVGIHDEPKQTSNKNTKSVQRPDHRQQSGSQQNKVAEKNLGYKEANPQENYKQLGKMVDQFGKKSRSHCKKEIRKSMTCYICPNAHGKTDEECMFASKDPHSQHMMYTEESSYGNPSA